MSGVVGTAASGASRSGDEIIPPCGTPLGAVEQSLFVVRRINTSTVMVHQEPVF